MNGTRITRIEIDHEKETVAVTEIVCGKTVSYTPGDIWQVIGILQNICCEFAKRRGNDDRD